MDDLDTFSDDAEAAADRTAIVFENAGERIAQALERAARSGELSFNRLAESIIQDLARSALTDLLINPLSDAIGSIGGASTGAKASGVTVNMNLSGVTDASGFERSKGQIAAGLARAVSSGQRYL